jgi:hypothetical protein
VTGPLTTRRQPRRRRITPNTNTSTTTMISTHNHVDMAASLVGPGQFKLTLLPATRASNSVMARRPPAPRSTAALRAPARGTPEPCDLPADLGWPGGCQPARPCQATAGRSSVLAGTFGAWPDSAGVGSAADHASAPEARALRATPSQPSPTVSTSTTRVEEPVGGWRGRAAFALLGWGNDASMAVPMRNGRRRAVGAGPMVRAFGDTRTCAEDGCTAQLSRYNPARRCAIHQGWDRQQVTRPRRRQP